MSQSFGEARDDIPLQHKFSENLDPGSRWKSEVRKARLGKVASRSSEESHRPLTSDACEKYPH